MEGAEKYLNHEIWFEWEGRGRLGEEHIIFLKYGHRMDVDGRAESCKLRNIKVIDPEGKEQNADLYLRPGMRDAYIVSFIPHRDGLHVLTAEYEGGVFTKTKDSRIYLKGQKGIEKPRDVERSFYSYQYCKAIVPVGEISDMHKEPLGHELEIIVTNPRIFHEGEEFELKVLYDGKPIEVPVSVIRKGEGRERMKLETSKDGTSLKLEEGLWMLLVKYIDKEKRAEEYMEKALTANLILSVEGGR